MQPLPFIVPATLSTAQAINQLIQPISDDLLVKYYPHYMNRRGVTYPAKMAIYLAHQGESPLLLMDFENQPGVRENQRLHYVPQTADGEDDIEQLMVQINDAIENLLQTFEPTERRVNSIVRGDAAQPFVVGDNDATKQQQALIEENDARLEWYSHRGHPEYFIDPNELQQFLIRYVQGPMSAIPQVLTLTLRPGSKEERLLASGCRHEFFDFYEQYTVPFTFDDVRVDTLDEVVLIPFEQYPAILKFNRRINEFQLIFTDVPRMFERLFQENQKTPLIDDQTKYSLEKFADGSARILVTQICEEATEYETN